MRIIKALNSQRDFRQVQQLLKGSQAIVFSGNLPPFLFLDKVLLKMMSCVLTTHLHQMRFFTDLRYNEPDVFFLLIFFFLFFHDEGPQRILFINRKRFLQQNFIRNKFKGFQIVFFNHSRLEFNLCFTVCITYIDVL